MSDLCIKGNGEFYRSGSAAEQRKMSDAESIGVAKARVLSEHYEEIRQKSETNENLKEAQEQKLLDERTKRAAAAQRRKERMKRDEAATKIQAVQRGRMGRKAAENRKAEENRIKADEQQQMAANRGPNNSISKLKSQGSFSSVSPRSTGSSPSVSPRSTGSSLKTHDARYGQLSTRRSPVSGRGGGKKTRVKRRRTKKSRKSKKRKSKQHRKKKGSTKKR